MRALEPRIDLFRSVVRRGVAERGLKIKRIVAGLAVILVCDRHHQCQGIARPDAIRAHGLARRRIHYSRVMARVARQTLPQVRLVIQSDGRFAGTLQDGELWVVLVETRNTGVERGMTLRAVYIAHVDDLR